MSWFLEVENTYFLLLCTQAVHLLHHRMAKRHISFVEVAAGVVLCVRPGAVPAFSSFMPWVYLGLVAVQIVGSVFITKLSPNWEART